MDSKIDCKLKPCEHALFCRACVANWRRQSAAKPKGRELSDVAAFGADDVVDLDGRPLDAPRRWRGEEPPRLSCRSPAPRRRRRVAGGKPRRARPRTPTRCDGGAKPRRCVGSRNGAKRETYAAAAEAEARRRREAEARAALNAAALATSVVAKDAGLWASRAV